MTIRAEICAAVVSLFLSSLSCRADECIHEKTQTNLCEFARRTEAEYVSRLPMKLGAGDSALTGVLADKNKLIFTLTINISYEKYEYNMKNSKKNMDIANNKLHYLFIKFMCENKYIEAFVSLGGGIGYIIKSDDGVIFDTVTVTTCPKSSTPPSVFSPLEFRPVTPRPQPAPKPAPSHAPPPTG